MEVIKGIAVSPGIVVGKALLLGAAETHVPRKTITPGEVEAELARFRAAVAAAIADLGELRRTT
ncbi:MAG: phosphoenolpyruvate-utilizing N-terminal domain-containing protein, partial [Planctomycetota bacterium]